jgi:hypothetical protein
MDEKEELRKNLRSALEDLDKKGGSPYRESILEIERTEVEKKKKDLIDEASD